MKELLNEVDVGEYHPTAAVALEIELCESLALGAAVKEKGKVGIPLVANDLAAREAANGNDHVDRWCQGRWVLGEAISGTMRARRTDVFRKSLEALS